MNNKGFTLIELLATIVILVLVIGLGSYAITNIIKSSKDKNYALLISNVKDAAEAYYLECKFEDADVCDENWQNTSLGELVRLGHLKGNGTDSENKFTVVNPQNNNNISDCKIIIGYTNGAVTVTAVPSDNPNCPGEY